MSKRLHALTSAAVLLMPLAAYGKCTAIDELWLTASSPEWSFPSNSIPVGRPIGDWGTSSAAEIFRCDSVGVDYILAEPNGAPAGITYRDEIHGKTYPVYKTVMPGVGYIVGLADDTNFRPEREVPLEPGAQLFLSQTKNDVPIRARIAFISTGRIEPGVYTIPHMALAKLSTDGLDVDVDTYLWTDESTITINSRGCTVTTPVVDVQMPRTSIQRLGQNEVVERDFSISLRCDDDVSVYATVTDQSDPSNTGDVLSPTPESEVQAFGLHLYANGTPPPLRFGPESAAIGDPTMGVFICSSGVGGICRGGTHLIPMSARYVRRPGATAAQLSKEFGKFEAAAVVTFSYR